VGQGKSPGNEVVTTGKDLTKRQLRRLAPVSSTFLTATTTEYYYCLASDATIIASYKCPITGI